MFITYTYSLIIVGDLYRNLFDDVYWVARKYEIGLIHENDIDEASEYTERLAEYSDIVLVGVSPETVKRVLQDYNDNIHLIQAIPEERRHMLASLDALLDHLAIQETQWELGTEVLSLKAWKEAVEKQHPGQDLPLPYRYAISAAANGAVDEEWNDMGDTRHFRVGYLEVWYDDEEGAWHVE